MNTNSSMDRFWLRTDRSGGEDSCWPFTKLNKDGYGSFSFHGVAIPAHRFIWMSQVGEIPPWLMVLHKCNNPPCVNLKHLYLGNHQDNMLDKVLSGRSTSINLHRGENHWSHKLTEESVRQIRSRYSQGETGQALSSEFKVSDSTIDDIVEYVTWKHVR